MEINLRFKQAAKEWIEAIIIAFVLAMIIRTFVVQAFKIPTGSMRPTLIEGDRIFVNKFIYRFKELKRGDVVVFKYPENPKKDFIKRLIATQGERLEIKEGHIWINGKLIEEPQQIRKIIYYNNDLNMIYCKPGEAIIIPDGNYFVLGDNSASSRDSRYWGFVKRKDILGQAMVIYWPLTRIRKIE